MRKLSQVETETVIRRSASDNTFDVWTAIPRDIRRLRKSAAAFGCAVEELGDAIRVRNLPVRALTFRASSGQKEKVG